MVGEEVYTYTATDADHDALLSYSLAENQITGEDEERHPITDINYLKVQCSTVRMLAIFSKIRIIDIAYGVSFVRTN